MDDEMDALRARLDAAEARLDELERAADEAAGDAAAAFTLLRSLLAALVGGGRLRKTTVEFVIDQALLLLEHDRDNPQGGTGPLRSRRATDLARQRAERLLQRLRGLPEPPPAGGAGRA